MLSKDLRSPAEQGMSLSTELPTVSTAGQYLTNPPGECVYVDTSRSASSRGGTSAIEFAQASHFVPFRCPSCLSNENMWYAGLASVIESDANFFKSIEDQLPSTGRQIALSIEALS
jgi:hypothetical protein